jgi:hypothetical protein
MERPTFNPPVASQAALEEKEGRRTFALKTGTTVVAPGAGTVLRAMPTGIHLRHADGSESILTLNGALFTGVREGDLLGKEQKLGVQIMDGSEEDARTVTWRLLAEIRKFDAAE